jgi:hypothetical protein
MCAGAPAIDILSRFQAKRVERRIVIRRSFRQRRAEKVVLRHAFHECGDFAGYGAESRVPRVYAGAEIGDRRNRVWRGRFCGTGLQCRYSNLRNLSSRVSETGATGLGAVRSVPFRRRPSDRVYGSETPRRPAWARLTVPLRGSAKLSSAQLSSAQLSSALTGAEARSEEGELLFLLGPG